MLALAKSDWGKEFQAYTSFHWLVLACCALAIVGACVAGRRMRGKSAELHFRLTWGWAILAYKVVETIHDCWPGRFRVADSLPLQMCDLASFVAAGAMITQRRTFRTLLYFWGLGLSPQAAIMPTLKMGYLSIDFWFFWVSHTMVIGSAMYDLIVRGYRPTFRDWLVVAGWSLAYAGAVTVVNLSLGVNYGYIGNTTGNPPPIEALGPWPLRAIKLCSAVGGLYLFMWGVWAVARRLRIARAASESKSP